MVLLVILVAVRMDVLDALESWVVRPRDLRGLWARPEKELKRLAGRGAVVKVAHGYWAVVPPARRAEGGWVPPVEELALAVAQTDYGPHRVALTHLAAARALGAVPRALGVATVAVPKQRPALHTVWGMVEFTKRQVERLDLQRHAFARLTGYVTSPEQTVLDLASPRHPGVHDHEALREALTTLAAGLDWDVVAELARAQRKRPAVQRAALLAAAPRPHAPERA